MGASSSMENPAIPSAAGLSARQGGPFLAADVGGTHARLALVQHRPDGSIEIIDHHKYACADFPGLTAIVSDFLAAPGRGPVHDAAIGCAGMRRDDLVISINLPWPISLSELRALGIERVAAVNDFVAVANAVQCMNPGNSVLLSGPGIVAADGPMLVIGPGTGLGAAYRVPNGAQALVVPSEAGQMAFAPGNAREIAVLAKMLEAASHVSNEQIVSGPGLLKVYKALCSIDGVTSRQASPADVVDAARAGEDAHAVEAVRIFCDVLGSLLGDLVMVAGATSVYIAGGIMPKIRDFIDGSHFRARFANKGVMRTLMEQVPVWLIDNPHKGVIGAASWYLAQPGI
ncbi:glucokinase [Lysobacter tyrosinilyticus]